MDEMLVIYGEEVIKTAAEGVLEVHLGGCGGALVARIVEFIFVDSEAARRDLEAARWRMIDDGDRLLSSMGRWTRRRRGKTKCPRVFPPGERTPAPVKDLNVLSPAGCARCGCRGWGAELPAFVPRATLMPRPWFFERYPDVDRDFQRRHRDYTWRSPEPRCGCDSCADEGCTHVREAMEDERYYDCVRCGCAQEFDKWGERMCFCDTCQVDGCSTRLRDGQFDLPGYVANGGVDVGQCFDCFGYRSAYDLGPVCPHCSGPSEAPFDTRYCDGGCDREGEPCYSCGYEERRELGELGLLTWREYKDAVMDRDGFFCLFDHRPAWEAAPVGAPKHSRFSSTQ